MNPYPRTWIDIDLPALAHNLALVRERIGDGPRIALVAKADAYGHGLVPVARHAVRSGADWIAVATVQEGIALRDAGLVAPILVLSPILEVEAEQAVFYELRVMLETIGLARALQSAAEAQDMRAIVHLPVDTGVSRFGLTPQEVAPFVASISGLDRIVIEGIGTHFADSGVNREGTLAQLAAFENMVDQLDPEHRWIRHAANSAGATLYSNASFELVRIGIAAYGVDPYGMFGGRARPVLSWKSRVMSLRRRPAGTPVSYAGTHVCPRDTTIATIGVGYGDGYPRSLSNRGFVMVHGQRARVIGLVCMDQILVDVTEIPDTAIGDEVTLIGGEANVETLSELAQTNVHEIVTRIMSRVPRRFRHGND